MYFNDLNGICKSNTIIVNNPNPSGTTNNWTYGIYDYAGNDSSHYINNFIAITQGNSINYGMYVVNNVNVSLTGNRYYMGATTGTSYLGFAPNVG